MLHGEQESDLLRLNASPGCASVSAARCSRLFTSPNAAAEPLTRLWQSSSVASRLPSWQAHAHSGFVRCNLLAAHFHTEEGGQQRGTLATTKQLRSRRLVKMQFMQPTSPRTSRPIPTPLELQRLQQACSSTELTHST